MTLISWFKNRRLTAPGKELDSTPVTIAQAPQMPQPTALDHALLALKDEDPDSRIKAIHKLALLPDERVVEPLINALRDESYRVVDAARDALSRIPAAASSLVRALKDARWTVRRAAAEALKSSADDQAVGPLIEALQDSEWNVRNAAVEALTPLADPRAVEPLLALLKNDNAVIKTSAANALGQLRDPRTIAPLIKASSDENMCLRIAACEGLGKLSDSQAVEPLMLLLKDKHILVQAAAVRALGELGDPRAAQPIIDRMYWCSNKELSEAVIFALTRLGTEHVLSPLLSLMKSPTLDVTVRKHLPIILGQLGDERAIEPLVKALSDWRFSYPSCAAPCAEALGRLIRTTRSVDMLVACLSMGDQETAVVEAAAKALGAIGDARATAVLQQLLTDSRSSVRKAAEEGLAVVTQGQG